MDSQHLANLSKALTRQELLNKPSPLTVEVIQQQTIHRRKQGGCGCNRRKEKLNQFLPVLKLGDKVETLTKVTGIKALVDRLTNNTESDEQ